MPILRKIFLLIAALVLPPALFSFGFFYSVGQVFGTPDRLKHALEASDIYEGAITHLLRESSASTPGQASAGLSSGQEAVQRAVTEALPADTLEQQTSQIIDGVYAWLQGDAEQLAFRVDLTDIQQTLSTSLSQQAKEHATQLPACAPSAAPISVEQLDPFSAECLPAGVTPEMVATRTHQEITGSDLFKDPVLDASDLTGKGGTSLQEQLRPVADIHQTVQEMIVIAGVTAVLSAIMLVLCGMPWWAGLRRFGIIAVGVGGTGAILALVGGVAIQRTATAVSSSSGADTIQAAAVKAVQLLLQDVRTWWLGYSILLVALGIAALVISHLYRKRQGSPPIQNTLRATPPKQKNTASRY